MDIEILKEFIKAFEGLGSEAKEGFIWYLCFFYISGLIENIMVAGCIVFAITKVYKIFNIFSVSYRLHMACYGYSDGWRSEEVNKVCSFLEENFKK